MNPSFLTLLGILSAAPMARAGNERGNGGNVVLCPNGSPKIELLDFEEARNLRGIRYDLGAPTLTPIEKIGIALDRLKVIDPVASERFLRDARNFLAGAKGDAESEALFLPNIELVPVADSEHAFLPSGCSAQQIVIQKTPEFPEDKRYVVSQSLWDQLDADNQAGLVLHELFYRDAISNQNPWGAQSNSIGTRYFNSYVASGKLATLTAKRIYDLLKATKVVTSFAANGVSIDATASPEPSFYPSGRLLSGIATSTAKLSFQGHSFSVRGVATFYENGNAKTLGAYEDPQAWHTVLGDLKLGGELKFSSDGKLLAGFVQGCAQPVTFQNQSFLIGAQVVFHPNGAVNVFTFVDPSGCDPLPSSVSAIIGRSGFVFTNPNGQKYQVVDGTPVFVYPSGWLQGAAVADQVFTSAPGLNGYQLVQNTPGIWSVSFSEKGAVTETWVSSGKIQIQSQWVNVCLPKSPFDGRAGSQKIKLDEDGNPLVLTTCPKSGLFVDPNFTFRVGAKAVKFQSGTELEFYPGQKVMYGTLGEDTVLPLVAGGVRSFSKGVGVMFDPNGLARY